MNNNQRALLSLLGARSNLISDNLTALELAGLYVDVGYLRSVLLFLVDQHWIQSKEKPNTQIDFSLFVENYFAEELSPLKYLHEFFKASSIEKMKNLDDLVCDLEISIVKNIKKRNYVQQKEFAIDALQRISDLFIFEDRLQTTKKLRGTYLALSLYRTFDSMDEVFSLNYRDELDMQIEHGQNERLYEGAGVGVQSGYSTILLALHFLRLTAGKKIVDLGSGYGRLGMAVGLLRPDLYFVGYEYVKHRVEIAMQCVHNFDLQDRVQFTTQDLSLDSFLIPEADVYYLYDPFSDETYRHVLQRLVQIGKSQKILVVTKGNAKEWLNIVSEKEGWQKAQEFDSGNLCIYASR